MNAICFCTLRPSEQFIDFCSKLKKENYDIFVCVDDNEYPIKETDIGIIKINNDESKINGFYGSVTYCINRACSRDKSLYYFCKLSPIKYKNIWFIEEDVFIPTINTIENIDKKYMDYDLLSANNYIYPQQPTWCHWKRVFDETKNKLTEPFAISMTCAIRVSDNLLNCIEKYADKHKILFFNEALFNTLGLQNKLSIHTPEELSSILYRHEWKIKNINPNNLYHPIKDISKQYLFRNELK
jgi:hypothetical protein